MPNLGHLAFPLILMEWDEKGVFQCPGLVAPLAVVVRRGCPQHPRVPHSHLHQVEASSSDQGY
jgi:hypothetical protein